MTDLLDAIGMVLVIEGVLYGLLPHLAKRLAGRVSGLPETKLRLTGLISVAAGVCVVWLARG